MNNLLLPTRGIANKGFTSMRRFVARFNFSCNLIGDSPDFPYWPYRQPLPLIVKRHCTNYVSL